ncbi:glycosyltransferase family 2 protein [Paenibacillus paeoniae]|uniref:glycosyltransferase family 2 protein n=1 Tax=Paenibacillus paeoniae TaxID=2292705 RepID=UPI001404083E|nr:glycosyltransferase family 2 protein [Paenibacillus paeoniae]
MEKLLSLCMIVKDEEETIDRCLSSISGLADEIIIVDTGSTDLTKEIAYKYTEHVFDFKWSNDFSAARNKSLSYATGKWILVLDADEYLNTDDCERFKKFIENEQIEQNKVYSISIISYVGESIRNANVTESTMVRLFPNNQGIHYFRPIHEQVVDANGILLSTTVSPITVYHTGYLKDTVQKKDKHNRNQAIFSELKQSSGFIPYDYFTIGNEYATKGDYKKALYSYERAFKKAAPNNPWILDCASQMFTIYMKFNRVHDAWEILHQVFSHYPDYPEYHAFKGSLYEYAGHYSLAKESLLTAFHNAEALSRKTDRFFLINPSYGSIVPLSRLLKIAKVEQNKEEIVYYCIKILQANSHDFQTLNTLITVLLLKESESAVITTINKIIINQTQRDFILLHKIFLSHGNKEIAKYYENKIENRSLISIEDLLFSSIINSSEQQFKEALLKLQPDNADNPKINLAIMIATLKWQNPFIDMLVYNENQIKAEQQLSMYQKIINNTIAQQDIVQNVTTVHTLLSTLFELKQFDLFDIYIDQLNHPLVISLLANYFYHNFETNLAVSFYNLLLEQNKMDDSGYINLAHLHINSGYSADAVPFLEEAIKLNPNGHHLFSLMLIHADNEDIRKRYRKQYTSLFAQHVKLPFIKQL